MTFEEAPKQFQEWFTKTVCDYNYGESWTVWFDCWKNGYYIGLNDYDHKILE